MISLSRGEQAYQRCIRPVLDVNPVLREIKVSPSVTQTWQTSGQEVTDHNHGTHYATHHQGRERQTPERNVAGFPYPGIAEKERREYGKTKSYGLSKRKRKVQLRQRQSL